MKTITKPLIENPTEKKQRKNHNESNKKQENIHLKFAQTTMKLTIITTFKINYVAFLSVLVQFEIIFLISFPHYIDLVSKHFSHSFG